MPVAFCDLDSSGQADVAESRVQQHYQDELIFLRELARFCGPSDTAHLLADRGLTPTWSACRGLRSSPGGSAKLDDEAGAPNRPYLRPIPSMTLMQFEPARGSVRERMLIPRGTEVDSVPVEGTACRFRTCYDAWLDPVSVAEAALENPGSGVYQLRLRFLRPPARCAQADSLRLFIASKPHVTSAPAAGAWPP
jgi:type VI secretion system protein ImpG